MIEPCVETIVWNSVGELKPPQRKPVVVCVDNDYGRSIFKAECRTDINGFDWWTATNGIGSCLVKDDHAWAIVTGPRSQEKTT